jgi:hypothetical protein
MRRCARRGRCTRCRRSAWSRPSAVPMARSTRPWPGARSMVSGCDGCWWPTVRLRGRRCSRWTPACGTAATPNAAPSGVSTIRRPSTRRASPSWPGGATSGFLSSRSRPTAGLLPSTRCAYRPRATPPTPPSIRSAAWWRPWDPRRRWRRCSSSMPATTPSPSGPGSKMYGPRCSCASGRTASSTTIPAPDVVPPKAVLLVTDGASSSRTHEALRGPTPRSSWRIVATERCGCEPGTTGTRNSPAADDGRAPRRPSCAAA